MVEGLAEKAYLRDTFGKYVSETVAASILSNRGNTGAASTLRPKPPFMFTDIEGFTGLSESTTPGRSRPSSTPIFTPSYRSSSATGAS